MPNRDRYPAGVPCWVDTAQPDAQAATTFYRGLFGWELENRMPAEAPGAYFEASIGGGSVAAVGSQAEPGEPVWTTYIAVDSADAATAQVRAAGGTVVTEPFDVFDAGRTAAFRDPEGASFSVWQAGRTHGAQVVNVPGSWNFSALNTTDPERAERFYNTVFGWEFTPTDIAGSIMVRRPGYADYLESIDPGITERHSAGGAPAGFTDCVAWLDAIDGDGQPGWHVTFTVSDADAAATRAAELGADILAEPVDIPWQRIAVIRDPQGAHLTLSQFKPPS